jgi:hypothetical protein
LRKVHDVTDQGPGAQPAGRLVVWGGREDLSSHRWIQKAFHETALKTGINSLWLANSPEYVTDIQPGDLVISADIYGEWLPYVPGADYVLHNFDGGSRLCQHLEQTPERLLRLQVWTDDATGDDWGPCRSFDREARTLFQPWGTDLTPSEFLDPVFNPTSRDATFVGAIWADQHNGVELGNEGVIADLKAVLAERRLAFNHLTQVSEADQVAALRLSRLTPALAGAWQAAKGYLPCRCFKLPSYGCAMFTNVAAVNRLFDGATSGPETSLADQVDEMLGLGEGDYTDLVLAQQEVAAGFTYIQSLSSILRAFVEMRS